MSRRPVKYRAPLLLLVLAGASPARADWEPEGRIGLVNGRVTQKAENPADPERQFDYAGALMAAGFTRDFKNFSTINVQFQGLFTKIPNAALGMVRQSFQATGALHVLGGARRIERPTAPAEVVSYNKYAVSFESRMGLDGYDGAAPQVDQGRIKGQVLHFMAGAGGRYDLAEDASIGADFLTTLLAVPIGSALLKPADTEVSFFLRTSW